MLSFEGCFAPTGVSPVRKEGGMTSTSLTLVLSGDVPLDDFANSMVRLRGLLDALTDEIGEREAITWTVADLQGGSAVATFDGTAPRPEPVLRVVEAFGAVGRSLELRRPIPFSPRVGRHARELVSVIGGPVTAVRFETDDTSSVVSADIPEDVRPPLVSYGSVEGRVGTLRRRPRVAMTLYDVLNDRAVYCLLRADQTEQVQGTWDRRVLVEGTIKRDPETGRALEVSQVEHIEVLPEVRRGLYRLARAVAPVPGVTESPEVTIRRLRDA